MFANIIDKIKSNFSISWVVYFFLGIVAFNFADNIKNNNAWYPDFIYRLCCGLKDPLYIPISLKRSEISSGLSFKDYKIRFFFTL